LGKDLHDKISSFCIIQDVSKQLDLLSEEFTELKHYLLLQADNFKRSFNARLCNGTEEDKENFIFKTSRSDCNLNTVVSELDRLRLDHTYPSFNPDNNNCCFESNLNQNACSSSIEEEPPFRDNRRNFRQLSPQLDPCTSPNWDVDRRRDNFNRNPNQLYGNPYEYNDDYNRSKSPKCLIIPWKGRILTPTINQLREFEGNLNLISQVLGSREPKPEERNYKIRLNWKGFVLWPTPQQLSIARGDLNALLDICDHKSALQSSPCFRQNKDGSPWRDSRDL